MREAGFWRMQMRDDGLMETSNERKWIVENAVEKRWIEGDSK